MLLGGARETEKAAQDIGVTWPARGRTKERGDDPKIVAGGT